mgnify:CR=1 FL=1
MPKYNWSEYNKTNAKLSSKLIRFNDLNEVNFIEDGLYNHIRDIFCLTILYNKKINRKTKILDYGSNLLALSNIKSKINTKLFDFSIYDPFYSKNYQSIKTPFKINFVTNKKKLKFKKFDIVNFGSSLQYIENINSLNDDINFKFIDTVLITHTPISLNKEYKTKQKNHKSLIQNIHTLDSIKKYFMKIGFNLVFKSRNNEKYIACEKKQKESISSMLKIPLEKL